MKNIPPEEDDEEIKTTGDMANQILEETNRELQVLMENGLSLACQEYTDKEENDAFTDYVDFCRESAIKDLKATTKLGDDLKEKLRFFF